jgi:hypothetical protein
MAGYDDITTPNKWQSSGDDAIKLAALRWFACMVEAESIQIYATDPTKFQAIEEALRECIKKIHDLRPKTTIGEEGECPPGYVMCRGECAPMCWDEAPPETTAR